MGNIKNTTTTTILHTSHQYIKPPIPIPRPPAPTLFARGGRLLHHRPRLQEQLFHVVCFGAPPYKTNPQALKATAGLLGGAGTQAMGGGGWEEAMGLDAVVHPLVCEHRDTLRRGGLVSVYVYYLFNSGMFFGCVLCMCIQVQAVSAELNTLCNT